MKTEKTNKFGSCPCMGESQNEMNPEKKGMMKCMKGAKWFLLVPGVLMVSAFLLGYFLEPTTVRTLWLVITGVLLVLGAIFYTMMSFWTRGLKKNFN